MKIDVAYDDRLLEWRGSAASPVRAKNAVDLLVRGTHDVTVHAISEPEVALLYEVHSRDHVERTLGDDPTGQGRVAALMFQGTVDLLGWLPMEKDEAWVGFAPQGAKHHAMWDHGSGFCTFNDFAWIARYLSARGERVLYVDFDAHHGDGVEALTYHDDHIMTASIHEAGIFPGTGMGNAPRQHVWNWPLDAESGDGDLDEAIVEVLELAERFRPTVILVAAGADGHMTDPLSSLQYTLRGYSRVARRIARFAARTGAVRVLVGGAGGYQPDDVTPQVWATFVSDLATELEGHVAASGVHDAQEVIQ